MAESLLFVFSFESVTEVKYSNEISKSFHKLNSFYKTPMLLV